MFYFVKNKTTKTKPKMLRKMVEKNNLRREGKERSGVCLMVKHPIRKKEKENIKEDRRKQ